MRTQLTEGSETEACRRCLKHSLRTSAKPCTYIFWKAIRLMKLRRSWANLEGMSNITTFADWNGCEKSFLVANCLVSERYDKTSCPTSGAGTLSLTEPHNEFLELCAVSTSGQLTEEEQKRLEEHLVVCQSCRKTIQQYETVASRAIPVIAAIEEGIVNGAAVQEIILDAIVPHVLGVHALEAPVR